MRTRKTAFVAALALGLVPLLAACGGSSRADDAGSSPKAIVIQAIKDADGKIKEDKVRDLSAKDMCSRPEEESVAVGGVNGGMTALVQLAREAGVPDDRTEKVAEDAYRAVYKKHCPDKLPVLDKAMKLRK
ncbi:hypothetical protein ACFU99_08865 [Streptomyces sp. NPDC057654]|uniref:hypothetical protein n=1 Tax=Streptomyces sp. NPDC057654 TaxID=3346196 RepID=UPI0036965078